MRWHISNVLSGGSYVQSNYFSFRFQILYWYINIFQENENILSFANGIWTKKTFFDQLDNSFLERLDENYLADFNFFGPNPVAQINEWEC